MADQTEQMNMLLDPNSAVREGEMNYSYQVDDRTEQMTPSQMANEQSSGNITSDTSLLYSLFKMADPDSVVREGELVPPTSPSSSLGALEANYFGKIYNDVISGKTQLTDLQRKSFMDQGMIMSAQMGLMEIDPAGTKDVVDGLEMTKKKVMSGGELSEGESSGIMAILQKLGGALSGMMGGGADQPMQQVMVDGNVTMLTAKEIMSAKNAGMLVQPVGEAIRDMEMNQ